MLSSIKSDQKTPMKNDEPRIVEPADTKKITKLPESPEANMKDLNPYKPVSSENIGSPED